MRVPLLEIQGLRVGFGRGAYRKEVLHGVDLRLERGEILGIIGESGSGKTMTGMALLRLLPESAQVDQQEMLFDGSDLPGLDEIAFGSLRGVRMAMIFQDPVGSFNPAKRIGWHFRQVMKRAEVAGMKSHTTGDYRSRAITLMQEVGIRRAEESIDLYPHQLSGGMLQRALIALVLALEPDLIVADEPTTNLDKVVEHQILSLFKQIQQRLNAGMIFVTHDMAVAASLCDRIAVMRYGEVLEVAEAQKLFADPQHDYTKLLIATARELSTPSGPRQEPGKDKPPLFEVKNLSLVFPPSGPRPAFRALDDISLDIRQGEVIGLVGESGSGKTTLGRALLRLYRPSGGTIRYKGQDITLASEHALRPLRRDLQMVFQDPGGSFNPRKLMKESLAEALRAAGVRDKREIAARSAALLERVRLSEEHGERFPHELSGGQLQRVAIARAVALDPTLIVADEAVSKLDVSVRAGVLDLFRDIQREKQLSMIFITHDLEVARYMCDRIAVLYHGKLLELGPTEEVFTNPSDDYTRTLLETLEYSLGGRNFGQADYGAAARRVSHAD
ncbi:dipeptide ABC transporter ATP-binding protein [Pseudodonghicola flavimaris]|uniref:ABC transporter ATP-binding protein n=1 Tax=Pseudodonghicola flavimaris TaxID=3050036 RepID=A0ABT7F1S3_9RHOB|nr:ABC transporter ATP-binding protein [Pseudodonghicola flavimaris]MDK3018557.1 ABC transporter ATP-binding protein [Pseudodonghicola flavimaris]